MNQCWDATTKDREYLQEFHPYHITEVVDVSGERVNSASDILEFWYAPVAAEDGELQRRPICWVVSSRNPKVDPVVFWGPLSAGQVFRPVGEAWISTLQPRVEPLGKHVLRVHHDVGRDTIAIVNMITIRNGQCK